MTERIGEFLLQIEAIKPYQVDDVLRAQKTGDTRLFGEIGLEFGYINDAALRRYIEAEEDMKTMTPSNKRLKELYCIERPLKSKSSVQNTYLVIGSKGMGNSGLKNR